MSDSIRDAVTTALDVLAVLALAVGAALGLHALIGWWSVAAGGLVVLAAVRVANWAGSRQPAATRRAARAAGRQLRRARRARRAERMRTAWVWLSDTITWKRGEREAG